MHDGGCRTSRRIDVKRDLNVDGFQEEIAFAFLKYFELGLARHRSVKAITFTTDFQCGDGCILVLTDVAVEFGRIRRSCRLMTEPDLLRLSFEARCALIAAKLV